MAIISISDSQINSADQVLVADASSKIPAKDGSQITVLNATNVASGTIATARLDTGTTANKIVVLDGSGNLPVVDGSLLTGVVSATVSASDPTISTNPSAGLGAEWNNSTSGEMYICTDATAGANVWTNVGAGSGDIIPYFWQGTQYGIKSGGYGGHPVGSNRLDTIEYFSFTSDGNSVDGGGNLTVARSATGAGKSFTHGYTAGGHTGSYTNVIDRYQFSNLSGNATDVGDLTHGWGVSGGCGSSTHGYVCGGYSTAREDSIEKWAYATSANGTNVGNLTQANSNGSQQTSSSHGYNCGGYNGPIYDTIDKWPFASDTNSTDIGNMTAANEASMGTSSTTHGYAMGGGTAVSAIANLINTIQKFSFSSDGNSSNVGTLVLARGYMGQCTQSTTHGYAMGGATASWTQQNEIDKFAFASDGAATNVGDLYNAGGDSAGIGY